MDSLPIEVVLEAIPTAMLIVDANGVMTHSNELAANLFGYELSELLGQPIELLVPADVKEKHVMLRERYMLAPYSRKYYAQELNLRGVTKSGSEFDINVGLEPVFSQEGIFVVVVIDQIKPVENQMERLRSLLKKLQDSIE
jgi:PAS domain S-box-containing protein